MITAYGVVDNTAVTTPLAETVALEEAVLDHVPPPVALNNVVELPMQADAVPVIAGGVAFTVTAFTTVQPKEEVYVIVVLPAATPVMLTGEDASIVAIDPLFTLQAPPAVASLKVITDPSQTTCVVEEIAVGFALIVNTAVAAQEPTV